MKYKLVIEPDYYSILGFLAYIRDEENVEYPLSDFEIGFAVGKILPCSMYRHNLVNAETTIIELNSDKFYHEVLLNKIEVYKEDPNTKL